MNSRKIPQDFLDFAKVAKFRQSGHTVAVFEMAHSQHRFTMIYSFIHSWR